MKKIIKGRKYDTETAKEICDAEGGNYGSFNYWCDTLYQKRTGEFFIHFTGGPLTQYAEHRGNESYGSSGIKPLSFEEARKFVEENGDVETYEALFGEVSEDEENETIGLSLPPVLIRKLKNTAVERHTSASELVAKYIETL